MGLLDGMLGNVLGGMLNPGGTAQGQGQGMSPLLQLALQILQQNGGIEGVLGKLRQAGFGAQADSWVGTGQNLPISPDALQQALGSGQLGPLASRTGMDHGDALGGLASILPQIIDQMTPQGEVPANHTDLITQALSTLQRSRQI